MQTTSRPLQLLVWGAVLLTILAIAVAYVVKESARKTALMGDEGFQVEQPVSNGPLPVLFQIPDFALTNQAGNLVTLAGLKGQVWITDIIFTRCAGPCPDMTRRMAEFQVAIPARSPVKFVTLTADPQNDTPAVLDTYARRISAAPGRWHFLTGTKKQIVDLAVQGLKLTTLDKEEAQRTDPNDLFIHSTMFVVVDQQGRARAVLESDEPLMKLKALGVIQRLLDEK